MPNKLKDILEELARHTYSDKYISKALSQIQTWIEECVGSDETEGDDYYVSGYNAAKAEIRQKVRAE